MPVGVCELRCSFSQLTLSTNCGSAKNSRADLRRLCVGSHPSGCESPDHFRWSLTSLVISNMEAWAFLKISLSLASALIMRRLTESCSLFFLM